MAKAFPKKSTKTSTPDVSICSASIAVSGVSQRREFKDATKTFHKKNRVEKLSQTIRPEIHVFKRNKINHVFGRFSVKGVKKCHLKNSTHKMWRAGIGLSARCWYALTCGVVVLQGLVLNSNKQGGCARRWGRSSASGRGWHIPDARPVY
jgi:hypothetical protein